jgi:hypothetical protein
MQDPEYNFKMATLVLHAFSQAGEPFKMVEEL